MSKLYWQQHQNRQSWPQHVSVLKLLTIYPWWWQQTFSYKLLGWFMLGWRTDIDQSFWFRAK